MVLVSSALTVVYLAIGILGGLAYERVEGNFLNTLASHCRQVYETLSSYSVSGLQLLVYEALSYECMRPDATTV